MPTARLAAHSGGSQNPKYLSKEESRGGSIPGVGTISARNLRSPKRLENYTV